MIIIENEQAGQRIDNFLVKILKGVPKSRIYRAVRQGEVRVNRGRIKPLYRLRAGDQVRIPPLKTAAIGALQPPSLKLLTMLAERVIYEDAGLLVVDKPAGMPVHGGSGLNGGLIELLRIMRPEARLLELIHRLDRETSGCLLIAKKRQVLLEWHRLLTQRQVRKQYLALVKGAWSGGVRRVEEPLLKNVLQSGERMVVVHPEGKQAVTVFKPWRRFADATLVQVRPITGRTHQIRVHAAAIGHPIAGDSKYGDPIFNQQLRKLGLTRLFLHAASISARELGFGIGVVLDTKLQRCLVSLTVLPAASHSRHPAA